eukprot:gnl/TRDRNA2_/TRDRNA2_152917_c1_seq1.p1 gnl/TRDRNA2_/TRDRNA2_152917_c1~~gnl/TRDRNA2_/TRDRNA2_152917_c1_seq1.p1  ORF type:complete len:709 (+),score=49.89 gnl/TRDRNA2_/TRDRNA2_152917_c1_seq1:62-2188(+)
MRSQMFPAQNSTQVPRSSFERQTTPADSYSGPDTSSQGLPQFGSGYSSEDVSLFSWRPNGNPNPPVIALDIDEVLVCYVDGFRKWLEKERPEGPLDNRTVFTEAHEPESQMRMKFAMQGGLDNLEPVPGSPAALRRLRAAGVRLEAVTSRPPIMRRSTELLLLKIFPPDTFAAAHFVSGGQKGITCQSINAQALVDDQLPNVLDAASCGITAVLFDLYGSYPWGRCRTEDLPPGVTRLETWAAVCEFLLCLVRTGGGAMKGHLSLPSAAMLPSLESLEPQRSGYAGSSSFYEAPNLGEVIRKELQALDKAEPSHRSSKDSTTRTPMEAMPPRSPRLKVEIPVMPPVTAPEEGRPPRSPRLLTAASRAEDKATSSMVERSAPRTVTPPVGGSTLRPQQSATVTPPVGGGAPRPPQSVAISSPMEVSAPRPHWSAAVTPPVGGSAHRSPQSAAISSQVEASASRPPQPGTLASAVEGKAPRPASATMPSPADGGALRAPQSSTVTPTGGASAPRSSAVESSAYRPSQTATTTSTVDDSASLARPAPVKSPVEGNATRSPRSSTRTTVAQPANTNASAEGTESHSIPRSSLEAVAPAVDTARSDVANRQARSDSKAAQARREGNTSQRSSMGSAMKSQSPPPPPRNRGGLFDWHPSDSSHAGLKFAPSTNTLDAPSVPRAPSKSRNVSKDDPQPGQARNRSKEDPNDCVVS